MSEWAYVELETISVWMSDSEILSPKLKACSRELSGAFARPKPHCSGVPHSSSKSSFTPGLGRAFHSGAAFCTFGIYGSTGQVLNVACVPIFEHWGPGKICTSPCVLVWSWSLNMVLNMLPANMGAVQIGLLKWANPIVPSQSFSDS